MQDSTEVFFKHDAVKDIAGSIIKSHNTYIVKLYYNQGNGIYTDYPVSRFEDAEEVFADEWQNLSNLTTLEKARLYKERV